MSTRVGAPAGPSTAAPEGALRFEQLADHIAASMALPREALTRDARLAEDLELDSIGVLELILVVEDLGFELTDEDLLGLETLGDLHRICQGGTIGR